MAGTIDPETLRPSWEAESDILLKGVTDPAKAAEILRGLGVDDRTAEKLAAHHCGTFQGDKMGLPPIWPPGSGIKTLD